MKKNKVVLPLIIILLLCFLPCAIYGLYSNIGVEKEDPVNPNHLHKLDNKLYYYDAKNELIGVYSCKTDVCDTAQTSVEVTQLLITQGEDNSTKVYNNTYVFIQDSDTIYLYDLKRNSDIVELKSINNYGNTLGENIFIVQRKSDDFYGVLNVGELGFIIPAEYSYVGAKTDNDQLLDRFVVNKDNKWYLVNKSNEIISGYSDYPIYDYDKDYIYCLNGEQIIIYDYQGNPMLENMNKTKIESYNNVNIISSLGSVYIYNNDFSTELKSYNSLFEEITYIIKDAGIEIYEGETLIDTYTLGGE